MFNGHRPRNNLIRRHLQTRDHHGVHERPQTHRSQAVGIGGEQRIRVFLGEHQHIIKVVLELLSYSSQLDVVPCPVNRTARADGRMMPLAVVSLSQAWT